MEAEGSQFPLEGGLDTFLCCQLTLLAGGEVGKRQAQHPHPPYITSLEGLAVHTMLVEGPLCLTQHTVYNIIWAHEVYFTSFTYNS